MGLEECGMGGMKKMKGKDLVKKVTTLRNRIYRTYTTCE